MKVWLVTVGEYLPTDGPQARLRRTGLLARELLSQGHEVTWWVSDFIHFSKRHRFGKDTSLAPEPGLEIRLLHGPGYKKNISLARIVDHHILGRKFARLAPRLPRPDVILCSLPTLDLSLACVKYGKKHGVPVALDLRDMWPDIFYRAAPPAFAFLLRPLIFPMEKMARAACRGADALVGITPDFVEWGLKKAGREMAEMDRDFPLAYYSTPPDEEALSLAKEFWRSRGVGRDPETFVVCLFSNLVRSLALETVISAARELEKRGLRFQFVFCGQGTALEYFQEQARGLDSVLFPGWMDRAQISALMELSHAGIAPYKSTPDFDMSIPNKTTEYMSAGLPVFSSLVGVFKDLVAEHQIGLSYDSQNPEQLLTALCHARENRKDWAQMGKNARELFDQRFSAHLVFPEMVSYLEQLAKHGKHNP